MPYVQTNRLWAACVSATACNSIGIDCCRACKLRSRFLVRPTSFSFSSSTFLGNALPKKVEQANDGCKIRDVWCDELRSSWQAQQDTREDRTSCGFTGDMKLFALNCFARFQVNALDTAPEIHCRREQDDNDPTGTGLYEIDLNWLQYSESSRESQAKLPSLELK